MFLQGQTGRPVLKNLLQPPAFIRPDSPGYQRLLITMPAARARTGKGSRVTAACNTTTFYEHLAAGPGQSIALNSLQGIPGGGFLGVGSITPTSGQQQGLVIELDNSGALLVQQQVQVNGSPVSIQGARALSSGNSIIAGIVTDGSNNVFVAQLASDLSTIWTRSFPMPSAPAKVSVDIFGNNQVALAALLGNSVSYFSLQSDGTVAWQKNVVISGLTGLVGLSYANANLELVVNCIRAGTHIVQLSDINSTTGAIIASAVLGNGATENQYSCIGFALNSLQMLGVAKTAGGYQLVRDITNSSSFSQVEHTYQIPGTVDFTVSAAMDNNTEALGFCLPADGSLVFIKQPAYYYTAPVLTRKYSVPVGSTMAGVARSADGGFLFGLNNGGNDIVLVKTDSIGTLVGCGYTDIANQFLETIRVNNSPVTVTETTTSYTSALPSIASSAVSLAASYDCNQSYCPVVTGASDCLSTYYKTLSSSYYSEGLQYYFLMRNNNQIAITSRQDRTVSNTPLSSQALSLFDEKGQFVKGVTVFSNGQAASIVQARQMDDKSIMLIVYTTVGNTPVVSLVLVSDNLQILWTKSLNIINSNFSSGGGSWGDIYKDKDGNYYYTGADPGYFSQPKIMVYKIDAAGNDVWTKAYQLQQGTVYFPSLSFTASSVIMIMEGNPVSVTARLDKTTGQLLNVYTYQNPWDGSDYYRTSKYANGRILYAGNTQSDNFLMAAFDSTGLPLKLRSINNSSIIRSGTVSDSLLYASYAYYDGSVYREALVKADTGLNILFKHEIDWNGGYPRGIGIGDNGSIYLGGNYAYDNYYYQPYLEKLDPDGGRGSCTYTQPAIAFTDINPQTGTLTFSPIPVSFPPATATISFTPDVDGLQTSAVLCSNTTQCNSVKISGPANICQLDTAYTFTALKDPGCNLYVQWKYDTAYVSPTIENGSLVKLKFKKTGTTSLITTLDNNCQVYTDTLQLQVQKSPLKFSLGNDAYLCPGDSILLNAGTGFSSYTWQDLSTDSTLEVKEGGKYYVQVTNVCGETNADTINITDAYVPALQITGDTVVCKSDTLYLQATGGFKTYTWTPAALQNNGSPQQVKMLPLQAQLVTLHAVTNEGCKAADSVFIRLKQARSVFLGADTSFCANDSVVLNAGNSYAQYTWSTGSHVQTITVKNAGTYWVDALDTNGCTAIDTMIVQKVFSLPVVDLGSDRNLCMGTTLQLDGGNYSSHQWQDGSTGRYYTVTGTGTYWVIATDNNHCSSADSLVITAIVPPPSDFLIATDSICQYGKLMIVPKGSYESYLWSTSSTQSTISVDAPGAYILTVKDANGCSGSDTIRVVPKDCLAGVFIPNAFTPGGPTNNVFRAMVYGNALSFRLEVYDRFGERVFVTTDYRQGWNGTIKGRPADPNTFVWQCWYHLQGSIAEMRKGVVILVR